MWAKLRFENGPRPYEEGIKTQPRQRPVIIRQNGPRPYEEGIKTHGAGHAFAGAARTDPDLMKKGLRPAGVVGALEDARTDPDLMKKGLRRLFVMVVSPSIGTDPDLMKKGLRPAKLRPCLCVPSERTQTL